MNFNHHRLSWTSHPQEEPSEAIAQLFHEVPPTLRAAQVAEELPGRQDPEGSDTNDLLHHANASQWLWDKEAASLTSAVRSDQNDVPLITIELSKVKLGREVNY